MGLFWDLVQQSQISDQQQRAASLESRVSFLEKELHKTQQLLIKTLKILEEQSGQDIDGDGRLGLGKFKEFQCNLSYDSV